MDSEVHLLTFEAPHLLGHVDRLDEAGMDRLPFGLIGFDGADLIRRYNARESAFSGLRREDTIGHPVFTDIAQCMNNYLVAQRFEDARAAGADLDEVMDYVLTWRMRPTRVRLRLLHSPRATLAYVLLRHR